MNTAEWKALSKPLKRQLRQGLQAMKDRDKLREAVNLAVVWLEGASVGLKSPALSEAIAKLCAAIADTMPSTGVFYYVGKVAHFKPSKPWIATPLRRPDLDDDPMGQYRVEPIATALQQRYDIAEPESQELDAIHQENLAVANLISRAPELLDALKTALPYVEGEGTDTEIAEIKRILGDATTPST